MVSGDGMEGWLMAQMTVHRCMASITFLEIPRCQGDLMRFSLPMTRLSTRASSNRPGEAGRVVYSTRRRISTLARSTTSTSAKMARMMVAASS